MSRRTKENAIEWDLIERQFRLGQKTNKQLASEFGVQPSTIGRRAEKFGWVADKREAVDTATNSLLIQAASGKANANATPTQLEIKVAAQTNADVVLSHRKGLQRMARLRDNLIAEVEAVTDNQAEFQKLGELLDESGPDARGIWKKDKANEIYRRVISLSGRVEDVKKLAEIDERVRKGQREAFNLDKQEAGGPIEDMLRRIAANEDAKKALA
jgi:hypothetical protein